MPRVSAAITLVSVASGLIELGIALVGTVSGLDAIVIFIAVMLCMYAILWSIGPWGWYLLLRDAYRMELFSEGMICVKCKYDLRASVIGGATTCPECGKEIDIRCPQCRYNLVGTIRSGRGTCPECGFAVPQKLAVSTIEEELGVATET